MLGTRTSSSTLRRHLNVQFCYRSCFGLIADGDVHVPVNDLVEWKTITTRLLPSANESSVGAERL